MLGAEMGLDALNRRLASLTFWSGGVVLLLAWGLGAVGVPGGYRPVADVLAELLALVIVVLAWRFRRGRVAVVAVVVAVVNFLVRGPLAASLGDAENLAMAALALLLPINLGILALLRERPLPTAATAIHLLIVCVQPWLVASALTLVSRDSGSLAAWARVAATREASLLAFLLAALFTFLVLALGRGPIAWSMVWVVAASALAMHAVQDTGGATLLLAAAQLVLLLGLAEDSYRLAYHDQLTGLPGRRALDEALDGLTGDFAIAMVDVDHFKRFNDRYGHDVGDQALRMVAECLRGVGGGGRAFRYGGEEFTVLFAGQSKGVGDDLEELRKSIADRGFALRGPKRPRKKPEQPTRNSDVRRAKLTVSIGLASSNSRRSRPAEVLVAADKALYRAKRAGRNRLVGS